MYDDCGALIGKSFQMPNRSNFSRQSFPSASDYKFPTTFMAGGNTRFKWLWLTKNNWLRCSKQSDGGFCLPCVLFSIHSICKFLSSSLFKTSESVEQCSSDTIRTLPIWRPIKSIQSWWQQQKTPVLKLTKHYVTEQKTP